MTITDVMTYFVQVNRAVGPSVRFGPFDTVEIASAWCAENLYVGASIIGMHPPTTPIPNDVWQ